jgi:MFS family permease
MIVYFILMLLLLLITSSWMLQATSAKTMEWCIYGVVFCTGLTRAYSGAGFNSFLSQLVPRENLVRAVSVNSMVWLIAAVIGPATSGILMGYTNITVAFVLVCVLVGSSVIVFSGIKPKPITWKPGNARTWESVKEGLRFVFNNKPLLGAMVLDMFAVLFGGAAALLPVFATDILEVGPIGLGWLVAATYMGNFIAIARLTLRPLRAKQGKILLYAVGGFGIAILVFALSGNFWLSFLALFASGLFDGISVIVRGTVVQLFVPDEMRGRVASVNSIFINSSNELGQFESGVTASVMGTVPSVVFGGCMTLVVVITTWLKAPGLRKFEY